MGINCLQMQVLWVTQPSLQRTYYHQQTEHHSPMQLPVLHSFPRPTQRKQCFFSNVDSFASLPLTDYLLELQSLTSIVAALSSSRCILRLLAYCSTWPLCIPLARAVVELAFVSFLPLLSFFFFELLTPHLSPLFLRLMRTVEGAVDEF